MQTGTITYDAAGNLNANTSREGGERNYEAENKMHDVANNGSPGFIYEIRGGVSSQNLYTRSAQSSTRLASL